MGFASDPMECLAVDAIVGLFWIHKIFKAQDEAESGMPTRMEEANLGDDGRDRMEDISGRENHHGGAAPTRWYVVHWAAEQRASEAIDDQELKLKPLLGGGPFTFLSRRESTQWHVERQEKEEDFAVDVDDQGSKVIPSTSALGDASRTFEPDEKNFYTAILVRDSNGIIDMSLEKSDVDYVMIKDITQPVLDWNNANPRVPMHIYDRILMVDRRRGSGDSAKSLQAPMPMPGQPVTLLCQRPIVRQLKFSKPAKLGMSTNFMPKDSVKPWIDAISEGSVKEWNQKRPEACVREHDRILSVNGFEDPPTAMVLQLLKEADVEITVLHYPE
ncbi:Uncharacterized protein SCF082_LOCUS34181 [Durusdinium trenchii]|uniref:PDZ domain-containing protein n=1 Tax=Durusdinium trenchii TaxID=1381693 RepID=A0ABP0NVI0_9DINO